MSTRIRFRRDEPIPDGMKLEAKIVSWYTLDPIDVRHFLGLHDGEQLTFEMVEEFLGRYEQDRVAGIESNEDRDNYELTLTVADRDEEIETAEFESKREAKHREAGETGGFIKAPVYVTLADVLARRSLT